MEITYKEIPSEKQALDDEIKSFVKACTTIPKETDIIYQYTNIDALFNGIIVKEPKTTGEEICLWASNHLYMNDPAEIETGEKYAAEILNKYVIEDADDNVSQLLEVQDYYITSFSQTKDSLPMWGMYGKNGAGIALGFDRAIIEKTSPVLYKCVYLDEELKNKVISFCEQIKGEKMLKDGFSALVFIALLALLLNKDKKLYEEIMNYFISFILFMIYAKDPAYKYEDEVRLLFQSDVSKTIKYRAQNNLIIPYIENLFPKEALKEIWIGPTTDMQRTIKSLKTYLDHKGFTDVNIIPSEVPYRG